MLMQEFVENEVVAHLIQDISKFWVERKIAKVFNYRNFLIVHLFFQMLFYR